MIECVVSLLSTSDERMDIEEKFYATTWKVLDKVRIQKSLLNLLILKLCQLAVRGFDLNTELRLTTHPSVSFRYSRYYVTKVITV